MLSANEGSITNTDANKNLINILVAFESGVFGPEEVMTTKMPMIPKMIDE
ncbi:MAG: hypothetical protein WCO10_02240 [bacterium]